MNMRAPPPANQRDLRWTSIRLIMLLGVASLFGSLISNGARSVTGPYLLLLGGAQLLSGWLPGPASLSATPCGRPQVPTLAVTTDTGR